MATECSAGHWNNNAVDRDKSISQRESFTDTVRLRKTLEESRKAFLNFSSPLPPSQSPPPPSSPPSPSPLPPTQPFEKKSVTKKISFKIKKSPSVHRVRKERSAARSVNTVQELARKYNELVERSTSGEPKIAKLVKRVNSQRNGNDDIKMVTRIPSVKIKSPIEEKLNETLKRKLSEHNRLRAKIGYVDTPFQVIKPLNMETKGNVKAAIEIFEQKTEQKPKLPNKPQIPAKTFDTKSILQKNQERLKVLEKQRHLAQKQKVEKEKTDCNDSIIEVLNIPIILKKCDSRYETMQLKKNAANKQLEQITTTDDWRETYDIVDPSRPPPLPPKIFVNQDETIYEELNTIINNNESTEDGYEICENKENIYETLPSHNGDAEELPQRPPLLPRRQKEEPLPPRPPSRNSYCTTQNEESESNIYESIYSKRDDASLSNYESIYSFHSDEIGKRDSILSDQQSNSIYGQTWPSWTQEVLNSYNERTGSDLSASDKSDDWVDLSDDYEESRCRNNGFVVIREKQKVAKKTSGWSQQMREQWNKVPRPTNFEQADSDSDHHYETLYPSGPVTEPQSVQHDDDFDSFDSDSESDNSFAKHDSGVDMGNTQLPEPPNNQTYVLTRLKASAGKHMRRIRRNWSLTKNDISKSLSRMRNRKSRSDLDNIDNSEKSYSPLNISTTTSPTSPTSPTTPTEPRSSYQNHQFNNSTESMDQSEKTKTVGRKSFLNKFKRSSSTGGDFVEPTLSVDQKTKSTFYLTDPIPIETDNSDSLPTVNIIVKNKTSPNRPQIPPPPVPSIKSSDVEMRKKRHSTSWYAECGVFKNTEPLPRRPNTFWYAEVGLYQSSTSTPSTSSAENSGSASNVIIQTPGKNIVNQGEDYYSVQEDIYYNDSIKSGDSSEFKKDDEAFDSVISEMQLRLQDEPLYQFYDAAISESVCQDGTSDFDYDGYEEVGKNNPEIRSRPSAMELISPNRNNIFVSRTLWCEIPEVKQSAVLSTLNTHQKKVQEAKFEMLTSEASYLNSLNVLTDHFVKKLKSCEYITYEEKNILFDKIKAVKQCSEKLLLDLEKCWQDNILLHGICDIVKQHADNNFKVYISYCENQVLLDHTLKKLKDRMDFINYLNELESSPVCQLLTLHSFLMLPMQRITRWPLLIDAVLKRLVPQDTEYTSCQQLLLVVNKIVSQCNEGARKMEQVAEMHRLSKQLEFAKGVLPITLVTGSRWLVKSGPVVQMLMRGDDAKLTFGKRFSKVPIHLFLFNDILLVAKSKSDEQFVVQHYCYRSVLEVNTESLASLPFKDSQGKNMLFVTLLENQSEKTVELLLSCNNETDKERWLEALSHPKSENPDETLYECWDCPQVIAIHNYSTRQPDELTLSRGDVINVSRKMVDDWYHGERIRDRVTGWFPANHTVEVANPHVRARNLKQRYRLLAFSENYLKSK